MMGMLHMLGWYLERYRAERRNHRRMMVNAKPWTGRALIVMVILIASIALWLIAPPAQAAMYTVTAAPYANVRAEPSKMSDDLGDMKKGEQVQGSGYSEGWVQVAVQLELTSGWIRADLLTLSDYPVGRYTNVSGGRVRIRKAPEGDHAAWLAAGKSVDVLRWLDVNGSAWAVTGKGFVLGDCLEGASE
jgi:hypothetical protein